MEFVPEEGKQLHEECSILILSALSIGNVGQLAVDLLISSMRAERVGYLDDPYVFPCVGNDAYGPVPQAELALPLEVVNSFLSHFNGFEAYDSPSNALTIVQQRSPVVKGMTVEFAKDLADFAVTNGKKHIILLSSLNFGKWQNIDMSSGLQIYYLSSTNNDGSDGNHEQYGWKKLHKYNPSQKHWKYLSDLAGGTATREDMLPSEDELKAENYYASLPLAALFSFLKAKGLKVTCLLCYCSEGDNISDAFQLAEAACKLLKLSASTFHGVDDGKWVIPLSWRSVYGPPPDISIF